MPCQMSGAQFHGHCREACTVPRWQVIYHLETFDVTTIRASTPMYLMARRIRSGAEYQCQLHIHAMNLPRRAAGVKMVLSGEGADEIFGGRVTPTWA